MTDGEFWSALERRGWASSSHPGAPTYESLGRELSSRSGTARLGNPRVLSPLSAELARPGSLSSRWGLKQQPYHTDCANWPTPPRYLSLYGRRIAIASVTTKILTPCLPYLETLPQISTKIWVFQSSGFRGIYGKVVQRSAEGHILRSTRM
jgi:hypothetical protein